MFNGCLVMTNAAQCYLA